MKELAAMVLAVLAHPAVADTTAIYSGQSRTITVEVATNGDARVGTGPGSAYLLRRSGVVYFIAPDPSGVERVVRSIDVIAVRKGFAEDSLKRHPGLRTKLEQSVREEAQSDSLVMGGELRVHGRTGTTYFPAGGAEAPILVISHDPGLAPVRDAMAMFEEFADGMARAHVSYDPTIDRMLEVLKTGAPLKLLNSELTEVRSTPIASSQFDLPGKVEPRDQVRREWEADLLKAKR